MSEVDYKALSAVDLSITVGKRLGFYFQHEKYANNPILLVNPIKKTVRGLQYCPSETAY